MAEAEEVVWVQLATRIPKALHRELKLYCVNAESSVMDFVTKAIEEKLRAGGGTRTRAPKRQRSRASR